MQPIVKIDVSCQTDMNIVTHFFRIVESEAQSIFVVPYLTGIAAWHDAGIWPNRPLEHAVNPLPRCKIGLRGYYSIRV